MKKKEKQKKIDRIKVEKWYTQQKWIKLVVKYNLENVTKKREKIIKKVISKSPWITHLNTGSCNGCDIEILSCLSPRYDIERFGVVLKASPRQADVVMATGPVNYQTLGRVKRIYCQIPDPKAVIAVGSCACTGGVYQECFNIVGGIDKVIPVDMYIPGCPPRPEAIINGVLKLVRALDPPSKSPNLFLKFKNNLKQKFKNFNMKKGETV